MRTIKELTDHMKKFKDAVVIVGPEALKAANYPQPNSEELEQFYTKKAFRRTPEEFWKFFNEKVFKDPTGSWPPIYDAISQLEFKGLIANIICQNNDGFLKVQTGIDKDKIIELHGSILRYQCTNVNCKTRYSYQSVIPFLETGELPVCEVCGKPLRPDTLLLNENYDDDIFYLAKQAIYNTHTLIVWGIDYAEEQLVELIAQYGDIKAQENATGDPEKQRVIVCSHKPELELNVNEIAFCEFLAKDNCDDAAQRFLKAVKESL
jgi:NAD-dependent deacetylase